MKHTLEGSYTPKNIEDKLYNFWKENGFFHVVMDKNKEPYSIVIPPPNVTGVLHMGHGLNNTLQDILIRFHRMLGKCTLWMPGTDHAGIATQNVVERRLKAEGKNKHDLGREAFVKKTWEVANEHHSIIVKQLEKIGCSCDWDRERFTLDEGLSNAVREVFVELYNQGLIYRGKYLINYCPSCGTALANDEVEHEEVAGALYHVKYQIEGKDEYIEIATTRPETILADVAIAVHPDDERYAHLTEQDILILPIVGRKLRLVKDTYVDKEFGTGALKITPAHDPNDFAIAQRHNLEIINILNADGTFNENTPANYQGKTVKEARALIIHELEKIGAFVGKDNIKHQVGHCYRCHNVVEPYYSDQWFVKMKPLAEKAYKAVNDGNTKIYPERWINTYNHWMTDIRDWCISRQLWWGHRIPVWYCDDCGEMMVSKTDITECTKCKSKNIHQDEDVLDTWFSSWLWPFSTFGWPEVNEELKYFYPTTALVTGYDILFFWVARMIMAGTHFMNDVPFKDVYLNGLIRDKIGRKMSKSLGNGIDPIEIIDEHGADAFRFTLSFITSLGGQDIWLDRELFKMGGKFANKIYNSAKYIFGNIDDNANIKDLDTYTLENKDKWILSRLQKAIESTTQKLKEYRFDEASQTIYKFYWNEFCDWYIEISKFDLKDESKKEKTIAVLLYVLEESMAMIHPFMPFITEEIYSNLPKHNIDSKALMIREYPKSNAKYIFEDIEKDFNLIQDIVSGIRNSRSSFNLPPNKKLDVIIRYTSDYFKNTAESYKDIISALSLTESLNIVSSAESERNKGSFVKVFEGGEINVNLVGIIDLEAEKKRLEKEAAGYKKDLEAVNKKLSNENFMKKAKQEAIDTENRKKKEFEDKLKGIEEVLSSL
ncbi:valine--tRNA ligase [Brachyspira hyodysenteriae]|uniref:valine--tRNA ligase n=1 Tax=Brachyspira hyodysenteriae TaxID=159 RepID=UPI00118369F3|nr:valine--tRNA ligase [Brachyspira hyodysenteriae]MBT8719160.1 valine--tRNA ligase [Brachyspira hyodysenteriae]MBT8729402.1 valine--tRNA ligase [Brachyspira hyodysenteriae]MBT8733077.1 valine--tRNA ligase [Brachyspira hyodysenteriae]MBT8735062.1 valine--tRNA ligase [Brachyspira hyodysenteriae]MBT8737270.1 valine--tRNA ligase [Brachyspira hyodysenteriae]